MLALSLGMVLLGAAGLTGTVTSTPVLAATLLLIALLLAFDAGRTARDLW